MKKLLLAGRLFLLFAIISCNDSAKSDAGSASKPISHKDHIMSVYAGIESGDMSKMDEFVADDIVDHGDMGDVKGRDSVKKMLGDIHNHFSNLKMNVVTEATDASGDYHFSLVNMTGTTKDASMGMPANTNVDRTSVDVVKFTNGKASEHWGFVNASEMMKMMNMNKAAQPDKMMDKKDTIPKK